MFAFFSLLGLAQAADVQPGLFLPGAAEVGALDGSIGGGVFCATDGAGGPVVQGHLAVTRRLILQGQVPILLDEGEVDAPFTAAARFDLLDVKIVRVAAFGLWGGSSEWEPAFFGVDGLSAGLATEIGTHQLAFDASVPLARVSSDLEGEVGVAAIDASELGVSVGLGQYMRVRGGVTSLSPEVSWRYERSVFYGELGAVLGTRQEAPGLLGRAQLGLGF